MLDIQCLMDSLSEHRPIFHSEADFQHALAWKIHEADGACQVRLEFNPFPRNDRRSYLDIWLPNRCIAIELKYRQRATEYESRGEQFVLSDQHAHPIGRYNFLEDVQRLERVVRESRTKLGYAILLTNDPRYWERPTKQNSIDTDFRLNEGRQISGQCLKWSESAGAGTRKGREKPIHLTGTYTMQWQDYSSVDGRYGEFRYLAVEVAP